MGIFQDLWRCIRRVTMYVTVVTLFDCAVAVTAEQACQSPLIVANSSDVFTATSYYSKQYEPKNALLNATGAWIPKSWDGLNSSEYLQIDLGMDTLVTSVATQGASGMSGYFVKRFRIVHSFDNVRYDSYREDGQDKSLDGNTDNVGVKVTQLQCPFVARYLRFYPLAIEKGVALKVQLYGCSGAKSLKASHSLDISNIKVTSVTYSEIEISWNISSIDNAREFYITYHAEHDKNDTVHETVASSRKSADYSYKIVKLLPCTMYDITVVAFGKCNSDLKKLRVQTTASIPAAPTILSATSSSPNSIELTWKDPRKSVRRCPIDITGYRVNCLHMGSGVSSVVSLSATTFRTVLSNLKGWTEYYIQLRAESVYGYSLAAARKVPVQGSAPTLPPVITQILCTAPGTIFVEWTAPPKESIGGNIKSFTLFYKEKGSDVAGSYTLVPDKRNFTIKDLAEDTIYEVYLRMANEGYVISSNKSEVYVKGKAPSPPIITEILCTAPGTILVKWKAPPEKSIGVKIRSFTIVYREKGVDWSRMAAVDRNSRNFTIKYLKEYTVYQVHVRMFTDAYVVSSNKSEVYVRGKGTQG